MTKKKNLWSFISINYYHFFCKNIVTKFAPSIGGFKKKEDYNLALHSGLLIETINIFSPKKMVIAQKKFLSAFLPGKNWFVEKHATCTPWSHYYQALYTNV